MGTHIKVIPWEMELFVLTHFKVLFSIANCFLSCLFPSIANDIHIISLPSIVSFAYEHFQIEFCAIGLHIQPKKCVTWSPFSLPPNFNTPSQFTIPPKRIRVLGVPLGTSSFTSSFIKDPMLEDVRHVNLLLAMSDVQITFRIIIHCFM